MLRVKICGITTHSDARVVAEAGGDAIGFNFFPRSSRYIDPLSARAIARALPASVRKVGVFVNASSRTIGEISQQVGLDCVQLHGDEPPSLPAELSGGVAVIRAFRLNVGHLAAAAEHLDECTRHGRLPDAVLIDSYTPDSYGGTGHTVDWAELAAQKSLLGPVPLILAGGLRIENVKAAIDAVQPWGVDTASGVEASAGIKDPEKVRTFIAAARSALP